MNQPPETYFSVDVETAGPNPGTFALLSIGACLALDPSTTFYCELQPDRSDMEAEALSVHGLTLEYLQAKGRPPAAALRAFADWVRTHTPAGSDPIFVAFNAPFDWMFISDYFHRYLGENPFGHMALDVRALYMGLRRLTRFRRMSASLNSDFPPRRQLTHNALEDAIDQAHLFQQIYAELNGKGD